MNVKTIATAQQKATIFRIRAVDIFVKGVHRHVRYDQKFQLLFLLNDVRFPIGCGPPASISPSSGRAVKFAELKKSVQERRERVTVTHSAVLSTISCTPRVVFKKGSAIILIM